MATYSELQITFNQDLAVSDILQFEISIQTTGVGLPILETWTNIRSGSRQVTLGIPTAVVGEISAINYITAFELDYNNSNLYVVSRAGNVVTIKTTDPTINFINPKAETSATPPVALNVSFVANNFTGTVFSIDNVVFSQATNPCTHVKVSVTTSEQATTVITPNLGVNTLNPYVFEVLREVNSSTKCKNAANVEVESFFTTPSILSSANIDCSINSGPTQSTVNFTVNNSTGLVLQYSIDNVIFQTSNIFDLVPGNYTIYVKDQYGCNVNKTFNVDVFGIQSAHFELSKSNSIRYANCIIWNNNNNFKTLENSLSFESDVDLPKVEIQQFQSNDVITTQFKSNYSDITAVVIKEDLTEDAINIVEKTNNIGLKDKRDARIIKIDSDPTKSGIYFSSGNLYNFDTGIDTGNDYALNGALPEWGIQGYNIQYSGSWFVIEDVVFEEDRNVYLLIITNTYVGTNDATVQVGSIYNLENYEVYEFDIDFANYIDKQVNVRINNNDPNFVDLVHLSELIDVRNTQKGTVEIRYKNETNTDILYSTGIEHKIRIPLNRIDAKPKSSLESNDTDTSTILLNAQSREVFQYTFHPVTEQKMETLVLALLHETIIINGEFFVSESAPEVEGAIGDTNWYIVKAKMTKANSVYNSQAGGNNDFSSGNAAIPNLLQGSSGYIKY